MYDLSIENIPGGYIKCLYDDNLTILQYNEAFLRLAGYEKEDISGVLENSFKKLIYPPDIPALKIALQKQLSESCETTLEYRLITRSGETMWILNRGNYIKAEDGGCFHCILIDISKERLSREELRLSLQRHDIIMEQSTDIIFEWDLDTDWLDVSHNWFSKFGYWLKPKPLTEMVIQDNYIHPDDLDICRELKKRVFEKKSYTTAEVRIRNANYEYFWFRLRAAVLLNESGEPLKAVGMIQDIDDEKRQTQKLKERAERDALTGLYNKMTAQNLAAEHLKKSGSKSAAFIIDIDNFKSVNDSKGHLFGDAVISELAAGLKRLFGDEIIGRIGGDEFLVFIKNFERTNDLRDMALKVLEMSQGILGKKDSFHLSCSVGIAICPRHGEDFNTLFRNADIALFKAKHLGKNRYVLFNEYLLNNFSLSDYSAINTNIESEPGGDSVVGNFANYVFKALYRARDFDVAANIVLEIMGKQFGVTNVYIFKESEENVLTCLYQWHDEASANLKPPSMLKFKKLSDYFGMYDENGIFYCKDVQTLSKNKINDFHLENLKSFLHCAIYEGDKTIGLLGFDDCNTKRLWTKEQIDVLSMVSEIIGIFLIQDNAKKILKKTSKIMREYISNHNSPVFAFDTDTGAIVDLNEAAKNLTGTAVKNCPDELLKAKNAKGLVEVGFKGNPARYLAHFSEIDWKGKRICIAACYEKATQMEIFK